ncbi:caf1 family ribonuclease protein [Rutstroemia sp. NJR-2017a BBW]|nr:caf1 family ribonuclease protein [Rutstroemia sp. NJR-2017a BBW]
MPPRMQGYGGGPTNIGSHYQQYPTHTQAHTAGLPPPSIANQGFMNANSMSNPFSVNGNAMSLPGGFGGAGLGMAGGTGLASQAAQMSFASAPLQPQGHNSMADSGTRGMREKGRIREVWKGNLNEEMAVLRQLVDQYPYISMDVKFPGIVARPMGAFQDKGDYHYQCLRCNVDLLRVIQVGITLFSADGESPPATPHPDVDLDRNPGRKFGSSVPCTWQFNFKFSLQEDMYTQISIDECRLGGTDFTRLERDGIDPFEFAAQLISSGLVCDEDKHWISLHAGYDFGYLLKIMLCKRLPDDEREFQMLMDKFFPSVGDIKYLIKGANDDYKNSQLAVTDNAILELLHRCDPKPSLDAMVEILKVKRIGTPHQAGSDSLVNGRVFFKIRERVFHGKIPADHWGRVFGINSQESSNAHVQATLQQYNQLQENTTPSQNGNAFANGAPSTPNNGTANLVTTPAHNNGGALGPLTPGNGGGVFGAFQFGKQQ